MSDLKPGNPLRVLCRTCKAPPMHTCRAMPTGRFHGKRMRDALRDWRANGTERIKQAVARGMARRPRPNHADTPIASLLDKPDNERAISEVSRSAKDMQTPEFWAAVWSDTP